MKNKYLNQFLFALFLSLGLFFGHTQSVFADEIEAQQDQVADDESDKGESLTTLSEGEELTVDQAIAIIENVPQFEPTVETEGENGETFDIDQNLENNQEENNTTAGQVIITDIGEATIAEGGAIVVVQPIDDKETKTEITTEEALAIGDNAEATKDIADAVKESIESGVEIGKEGVVVTGETGTAVIKDIETNIEADKAIDAATDTYDNYQQALDADTHEEAQAAADQAKENAEKANAAAKEALAKATETVEHAKAAVEAYEKALAEYESARQKIEADLEAGRISLEDAVNKTSAAKNKAEEYYESMVLAQKEAEEKAASLKEASEVADEELKKAIADLGTIIAENAKTVAQKTAITVATGAAYEAAIIAERIAKLPVEDLDKQINVYEGFIADLQTKIDEAQSALVEAETKYETFKNTDDYKNALDNLNNAKAALEIAQKNKDDAEAKLEQMKNAAYSESMQNLQNELNNNEITTERLKVVEEELTLIIFQNKDDISSEERNKILIEWDISQINDQYGNTFQLDTEETNRIRYLKIYNPNGSTSYYKMSLSDEDGKKLLKYEEIVLQYDEVTTNISVSDELKNIPTKSNEFRFIVYLGSYKYGDTGYYAVNETSSNKIYAFHGDVSGVFNIDKYYVNVDIPTIFSNIDGIGSLKNAIKTILDAGQSSFEGIRKNYKLIDPKTGKLEYEVPFTSNIITDRWKKAEEEINSLIIIYNEVTTAVTNAENTFNELVSKYEEDIDQKKEELEEYQAFQNAAISKRDELIRERDGGTTDLIIRSAVTGNADAIGEAIAEAAGLGWKVLWGNASEEEIKRFNELTSIDFKALGEDIKNITTILNGISKGEIDGDVINAASELINNSKFAPQTKLTIMTAIKEYLAELHHESVEALKEAVENGKIAVKDQNEKIKTDTVNAAFAKVAYIKGAADAAIAKDKADYAWVVLKVAENAYTKAEEALESFNEFAKKYDPNKALIDFLRKEKEIAEQAAVDATAKAGIAVLTASAADKLAEEAQKIADSITDYDIWVSGKRVSSKNQEDVLKDKTVSYDDTSNTLSLHNANITVAKIDDEFSAGIYSLSDNLSIIAKGTNTITAKKRASNETVYGIAINGTLTIKGSKNNAALTIDLSKVNSSKTGSTYGIIAKDNISIKDIALNVVSGNAKMADAEGFSLGIFTGNTITIKDSIVNSRGGKAEYKSYGVIADKLNIENSSLNAIGGDSNDESAGIKAKQVYIKNSEVNAKGGRKAKLSAGIIVNDLATSDDATVGTLSTDRAVFAANKKNDPEYYLKVSRKSEVIATGGNNSEKSYGIFFDDEKSNSKILVKDDAVVTAVGGNHSKQSVGINAHTIEVRENGKIISRSGKKNNEVAAGIIVHQLVMKDDSEVTAESWASFSKNSDEQNGSVGIIAREGITLSNSSSLVAESNAEKNVPYSFGIFGNVTVNDKASVSVSADRSSKYTCGIIGDLVVKGDKKQPAEVYINAASSSDKSIGLEGNLNASGNFEITIKQGTENRISKNAVGILADEVILDGSKKGSSFLRVTSGEASETSCGIKADMLSVKKATVYATSGDSETESFAIKSDVKAGGNKGSWFYIYADSGNANHTVGIVGDITAKGIDTDRSIISARSGSGLVSIGIYNEAATDDDKVIRRGSNIDLEKTFLISSSGFHDPVESFPLISYGIYANRITVVSSDLEGRSCINEEREPVTDFFAGESRGLYVVEELNATDSEVSGGSAVYAEIAKGIHAASINATRSTINGIAGNSLKESYGIYAEETIDASEQSEINGKSGDTVGSDSYGIYVHNSQSSPVMIQNSTIKGIAGNVNLNDYVLPSDTESHVANSAGIYISAELQLTDGSIAEGTGGSVDFGKYTGNSEFEFNSYGIYTGTLSADNCTADGYGASRLVSGKTDEIMALSNSYGIYADTIRANNNSKIIGEHSSETILEDTESDKPLFDNSYGIYTNEIVCKSSTVKGYGQDAVVSSTGIQATGLIDAEEGSEIGGYAGSADFSNGIILGKTDQDLSVYLNNSSMSGGSGENSEYASGIYLATEGNVLITLDGESKISGSGEFGAKYAFGLYGDNLKLTMRDNSEAFFIGCSAEEVSAGIYLDENGIINLSGKASLYATGDNAKDESYGIYANSIQLKESSNIEARSGEADESVAIYLKDEELELKDRSILKAVSSSGYGLANGTINALDHSAIVVAGGTRAFDDEVKYYFNGRDVRISDQFEGDPYTYWNRTDPLSQDTIKYVSIDHENSEYVIVSGADQTWKKDSSKGAEFIYKNTEEEKGEEITFDWFDGIWVDGKLVDPSNYTAVPGSVVVTLKPSFLNSLSVGEHSIIAYFKNGKHVTSKFHIAANVKPTPTPGKKTSGGTTAGSVVTCQMAGYPNGYAWNEAAKACQPGYIDDNGVFHSYKTSGRYNTPNTADEGMNPFYLLFLSMMSAAAMGYAFRKEN